MSKEHVAYLIGIINAVTIILVILFSSGCSFCTVEQTRCLGNVAQICDGRNWREIRNCDDVQFESGNRGQCQQTPIDGEMTHTCLEYQDGTP